jgi:hypothetical protein
MVRWLSLVFALAAPRVAFAYRPFDGTDADVAAHGEFEVELGAIVVRDNAWSVAAPSLVLNYGIAPGFELVLQGNLDLPIGASTQLSDAAVLVKSVLRRGVLQGAAGPSIALESGILLPEPGGQCCSGLSEALIVSHRAGGLTLHWNGEIDVTRQETIAGVASVIGEGPQAWRVRPVAEALVSLNDAPAANNHIAPLLVSGLAGLIARVSEPVALDAAVRVGWEQGFFTELRLGLTFAL